MIAFLGHVARHGRLGLVIGLLGGLLLPQVAVALRPWLPEMIGVLLFLTALRIGWGHAFGSLGALGHSLRILLGYQVALPVLAFGLFWVFGMTASPIALVVVLALAAPPITGSPNFAILLGHDPAPALRLLVLGTALFPLTVLPIFWLLPVLGSATAAAGIARGLYGGTSEYWASGLDGRAAARIAVVETAAKLHKDHLHNPLEILRRFGGRDIAGLCGAILAARHQKIPVLLDGFVSCAAAAVLHQINPRALDHCMAAHLTKEPGHRALLDRIGMSPLLDFGMGIGDGSGAAMTLGVIKAAAAGANSL